MTFSQGNHNVRPKRAPTGTSRTTPRLHGRRDIISVINGAPRDREDALLWAPRGHNCIRSDSTLGLWMHRCTVAEQCDLIAMACATSNIPLTQVWTLFIHVGRNAKSPKTWTWRIYRCHKSVPLPGEKFIQTSHVESIWSSARAGSLSAKLQVANLFRFTVCLSDTDSTESLLRVNRPFVLTPDSYLLFCANENWEQKHYRVKKVMWEII